MANGTGPGTGPQSAIPDAMPATVTPVGVVKADPTPDPVAPITQAQAAEILGQLKTLTTIERRAPTPEEWEAERQRLLLQGSPLSPAAAAESDKFEDSVKPKTRAWKAIKWAAITLVGGAATIFGLGVGYQKAIGDNATKDDIQAHVDTDLEPVKTELTSFKNEMEPVKEGVGILVDDRNKAEIIKKLRRKLERHDKDYQEALQEYTADKSAGRRTGQRPRKTEAHLELEEQVETLEDALEQGRPLQQVLTELGIEEDVK